MKKGHQETPAILKHIEIAQNAKIQDYETDVFRSNLQKHIAKRIKAHEFTLKMIESREKNNKMTKALKSLQNKTIIILSAYKQIQEDIYKA